MKNIVYFILTAVLLLAPFNKSFASDMSSRLRGRILLQVESHGEAWYVNPDNEKRYFLGRPADAFQVMRELGLGISNKDFDSFNNIAPNRLSGKILLKVEDSGKAYYVNPVNLRMYFLGSPADAFNVMRSLGLGITNKDLEAIPIFVTTNEQKVLATAREVIGSLSARDYQKLEGLVSPDGLSLDLYPRFDLTRNLIAKNVVSLIPNDTKIYLWGYTDGKGDPINLTRAEFLTKYIYTNSVDYLKAPDVAVNKILGSGNSINTIDKDVNGRTYVAFHFLGFDPKYAGMDWTTLYLIFDSVNGEYKLRGIAKDNWTI